MKYKVWLQRRYCGEIILENESGRRRLTVSDTPSKYPIIIERSVGEAE